MQNASATAHFAWSELDPTGVADNGIRSKLLYLATNVLEPIRTHFGKPVHITSGYRSIKVQQRLWDEAVKKYGSPEAARAHVAPPGNSQHELGNAADLYIEGVTPEQIAAFAATLSAVGGIGIYPSWVHVDTRPRQGGVIARW